MTKFNVGSLQESRSIHTVLSIKASTTSVPNKDKYEKSSESKANAGTF